MFTRACPNCQKFLSYKTNTTYSVAVQQNRLCKQCVGIKRRSCVPVYLRMIGACYVTNLLLREKTCENCGATYCDVTKRNLHNSCTDACSSMRMVNTRRSTGSYVVTEEQKRRKSEATRAAYENGTMSFTDEMRANHAVAMARLKQERVWSKPQPNHWTKTDEGRKRVSEMHSGRKHNESVRANMSLSAQRRLRSKRESMYTSAKGGFRTDLNQYFRSGWEANFARIQEYERKKWEFEPATFRLDTTTTYTPDFLVDNVYYEIKGRMTQQCQQKLDAMEKLYPDIAIVVIGPQQYNELRKKYHDLIAWEGK